MAGTRKHDEQARDGWRINGKIRSENQTAAFTSPIEANPAPANPDPSADAVALVESSTYAESAYGGGVAPAASANEGRIYGGSVMPVDPYVDEYTQHYADPEFDDTVLGGLHYRTAAPRQPIGDVRWAGSLRRFARATVWCLPAAVIALALASVWGWPTPTAEPVGASPGTWLFVSLLGLGLWLTGVVGLCALVAATAMRSWGIVAVIATIAGTVLVAPVLGVLGLARPAVVRTAGAIGPEPAGSLQAQFLDGAVGRWLGVCGFALLAVGAIAVSGAILGSRVLNRLDGWLVLGSVAVAAGAAYLSWEFLLTLAAMVLLAATLGLAWTASRLSADGGLTGTD